LEPDIPASSTDSHFRKLPASGKAEEQTHMIITLTVGFVIDTEFCERPLFSFELDTI
jgi:hypothetical protein